MDSHIRNLLTSVEKGENVKENLINVHQLLKQLKPSSTGDSTDSFSLDLFVIFAELAFKHGIQAAASEMLKVYFSRSPASNQFLCRAYLCQAQIAAPQSSDQFEEFEKSVVYLLKAISFAKENPRYHFLVYNASVLYWNFCRSFLKPGTKQLLTKSMQQVVKALDDINDGDFEWRATLMIALVQCHLDGNRAAEASTASTSALSFIRNNFPAKFKELFGIVIKNNLVDSAKLAKDMKMSPELAVYYRLCKLKSAIDTKDTSINISEEVQKLLKALIQGEMTFEIPEQILTSASKKGAQKLRPVSPTNEDTSASSSDAIQANTEKSPVKTKRVGASSPGIPSLKKLPFDSSDRACLLLDLARIGLELNLLQVVSACIEQMKTNCIIKDKGFLLEVEFLEAMLSVKLGGPDIYSSQSVQARLKAIAKCEEAVLNSVRNGDPKIIQVGCITLWNIGLPLLQKNLRKNLRKPLQVIATALEDIKSLLVVLRCQIHFELGKCEEDVEQIEMALQNYKKALQLDDSGVYNERLEMAINRMQLRATLYDQPERPEDIATMIIEQAQASDSGSIRMKRSLLIKVGLALAPDVFDIALDSENEAKALINAEKTQEGLIKQLNARAQQYIKCIVKIPGHLERLGGENDLERAHLWADLAKIARKQQVWDVCRVASKFCLLYDDSRWTAKPREKSRQKTPIHKDDGDAGKSPPLTPIQRDFPSNLLETDTLRMLAEVHFINAEALIHLLRSEGVELNDEPIPPKDTSKKPKGYVPKKPEDLPDWIAYRNWIRDINQEAVNSFLRAATLGKEIKETWIVVNAATYFWNYNNHIITRNKHRDIHDQLQVILDSLKKVGHEGATTLLVHICVALAQGYIQPWLPPKKPLEAISKTGKDEEDEDGNAVVKSPKGRRLPANMAAAKAKIPEVTISAEAQPDLKKALEVIEYAMKVTNGSVPSDIVPLAVRYPMLQKWVFCKQLLQQPITKTLGTTAEEETANEGQNLLTKAQVAVEMLCLSINGIYEFKDGPTLEEASNMVESCMWTDNVIELQLWTRLSSYARFVHDHQIVLKCTGKALDFANTGRMSRSEKDKELSDRYVIEQKMFSYASCMRGETLIENMRGQNSLRHEAIHNFLQSAQFGRNANNYDLVLFAARNYWNSILPLIGSPFERQLLKESLKTILECLAATMSKTMIKAKEELERLQKTTEQEAEKAVIVTVTSSDEVGGDVVAVAQAPKKPVIDANDDLSLQAAMYGVLFQVYADQNNWEEGLKLMDFAISSMPRTKHRLLLFKHRVMVKAKLGHNVSLDIQKFRNESESQLSQMWHKLALFSKESSDQLLCYQNAIEALMKGEGVYQKVDYLIEFAQWLKVNDYPLEDTLDILDWASDLLLNIRTEESRPDTKTDKRGPKRGKSPTVGNAKKKKDVKTEEPKKSDKKEEKKEVKKEGKKADVKTEQKEKGVNKSNADENANEKTGPAKSAASEKVANKDYDPDSLDINEEDYIPVERKAEIVRFRYKPLEKPQFTPGLKIEADDMSMADLADIKQLEYLLRISVMAASIAGQGYSGYMNYCISAYGYLHRIWQLLLSNVGAVLKEMAKLAAASSDPGKSAKKGKGKEKEKDGAAMLQKLKNTGKSKGTVKEKPKRKGPLDFLPSTIEDWSTYDVPDEVVEASSNPLMKSSAVNESSITKPSLLLNTLDALAEQLRTIGFNHLCVPVLAFEDFLSRGLVKNQAYNILVHLRAAEVCLELNLLEGVKFHERLVSKLSPVDMDLASSWIEMAVYKEKQYQVEQEEKRIQASLKALLEDEKLSHDGLLPTHLTRPVKEEESKGAPHLGLKIGSLNLRHTWTSTAEVLIRLGLHQPARQYLYAALISAKEFDEKSLQAEILYHLATLSYKECQYLQAIQMIQESQGVIGSADELFWFKTLNVMIDCHRNDTSIKNNMQKAINMCSDALMTFKSVFGKRPTEVTTNGYITGLLEAKTNEVKAASLFGQSENLLKSRNMRVIMNTLDNWKEAADKLRDFNFLREAVSAYKEIGRKWSNLAEKVDSNTELKHDFLVKAYNILKEATMISKELTFDILSSLLPADLPKLSLPVQREYVDTELRLAGVLLQILEAYVEEEKLKHDQEKAKGHVQKVVEEVIRQTPVYTESQKEWIHTTGFASQMILSIVCECFHHCSGIPTLKADVLYCGGKCLRLISLSTNMDSANRWAVDNQLVAQLIRLLAVSTSDVSEQIPKPAESDDLDMDPKELQRQQLEIKDISDKEKNSINQLAQASELLGQGLQIALQNSLIERAKLLSYELVECYGQFDPAMSSQYLALYQSCCAGLDLKSLLHAIYNDPMSSQKAAIVKLHQHLIDSSIKTNLTASQLYTNLTNLLQQGQAWQKLSISSNHLDLIKDLPANWQIVVLQHSPCRRYLCGAVLDKSDSSAKKGEKGKVPPPVSPSKAKIERVTVNPEALDSILEKMRDHRFEVMTTLLKQEYQRTIVKQQERMLASIGQEAQPLDDLNEEEDENELQGQFDEILRMMEEYVAPLAKLLELDIRPSTSSSIHPDGKKERNVPETVVDTLVILADSLFLELPLEALDMFDSPNILSMSRDLSLQMLYQRYHIPQLTPEELKAKQQLKASIPSRIPGARDANKKQAKYIPLDRPVPPNCMPVDTNNFKFMVDPHGDVVEEDDDGPMKTFDTVFQKYGQQFTTRWLGITHLDHEPSISEWEIYLSECSSFLFYGFEHLVSYISPEKLVSLDIPECMICLLFDLCQTSKSFTRRSINNVLKQPSQLSLETPLKTAMMLSLSGVKCVVSNQWHCTLPDNSAKLQHTFLDLLEKGRTTGVSSRLLCNPEMRKAIEEAEKEAIERELREKELAKQQASIDKQEKEAKGKNQKKLKKGKKDATESEPLSETEAPALDLQKEPESLEPKIKHRQFYNMVTYGLPNLIVTQM